MGIFRIALLAALLLASRRAERARGQDLPRARRRVEPGHAGGGRDGRRQAEGGDRLRLDAGVLCDPRLPRRVPRGRGPAGGPEPPLALLELVDGEVGDRDDLRARDDPRPDVARRPGRLARPGGRQGARRDHGPRPAHDDLGPQVERPPRLQHLHDAGPRARRADARGRQAARHVLRIRAERRVAAGRDRRPVGGRGHDGLRPARADDAARDRGGLVGLDPRQGRARRRVLRRADDP